MRPGLSCGCGDVRKSAGLRRAVAVALLALGFGAACGAQQVAPEARLAAWTPSIDQVKDAASLALLRSALKVDSKLLKVTRRPDLEDLLSTIVESRGSRGFYLYDVEIPSQASYDGPWAWVVAVAARKQGGYELYSFESVEKRTDVAAEFNRFASALSVSLSPLDLDNFATFFLETTVPFRPGEVVLDQDSLRDTVGRHYFTSYAEAWRSIDAYSRWWHGFLDADGVAELGPRTEVEPDGGYRVTLNRVVTTEGAHPQVQQWQLEISPKGNVQATSMRTVFPKSPRWIFYDSPDHADAAPLQP